MHADHILRANLLDIIFEFRNKEYGAYVLRKNYNERLYKSLGISFLIMAAILSFALLQKKEMLTSYVYEEPGYGKVPEIAKDKPLEPQKPKQPEKKLPKEATSASVQSVPLITGNTSNRIVLSSTSDSSFNAGPASVPTAPAGLPAGLPGTAAPAGLAVVTTPDPVGTTVHNSAEIMPAYPGGVAALRKFLVRNLTNPKDVETNESISVKIRFIVGYDGLLKGFETIEDGGEEFNNEVIRVLKKMPAWIPGKTKGQNVSVYFTIPVTFTAAGE